ncbi:hypothetical protein MPH_12651 [Macrophomina phaseolina MS6]|uniref:Nephrocystin 3-like N-terminal domain-containing protein n=1 Tax=Macrophomina phaseolina (strain MS6) TaxID=1126212 RepID=K2RJG0_MACPH|nr:hypothetical protein MPH_12651 [Macrophomina phaseolina MS6]
MEIAGLAVPLAIQATQALIQYIRCAKGHDEDKKKLLREIAYSRGTIESVDAALQRDASGLSATRDVVGGEHPLMSELTDVVAQLYRKFEVGSGGDGGGDRVEGKMEDGRKEKDDDKKATKHGKWLRFQESLKKTTDPAWWENVRRTAVWPFKKGELEEYVHELARLRQALIAALVGDTAVMAQGIGRIENQVNTIAQRGSRERILHRLNVPGVATAFKDDARYRRYPGTNDWFLEHRDFVDWVEHPGRVLWVSGKPGCGKSTLCRTVVRWLHSRKDAGNAVIHAFLEDSDTKRSQSETILRSIVKQSLEQLSVIPGEVLNLDDEMQDSFEEMYGEFVGASEAMIRQFGHVFVVIDGLADESGEGELNWLRDLCSSASNLSFLVLSPDVCPSSDFFASHETSAIELDGRKELEEDIRRYITHQVENDANLCKWSMDDQQEMKQRLNDRACGTLVANCINELKQYRTRIKLREALQRLPKSTRESYNTLLKNVLAGDAYRTYAIRALQWLCYAERPLSATELRDLLATDEANGFNEDERLRDADDVLECCLNLVEMYSIDEDGLSDEFSIAEKDNVLAAAVESTGPLAARRKGEFIRLSQPHLKEFLASDDIAPGLGTGEKKAQALLARYCLLYLRELRSAEDVRRLPASVYAATRWDAHLRAVPNLGKQEDLLDLAWAMFSDKQLRMLVRTAAGEQPEVSRLRYFAEKGIRPLLLRCLQNNKAKDPRTYQKRLNDALCGAVRNRRMRIAELLVERGAVVEMPTLRAAMVHKNAGVIKMLMEKAELGNTEVKDLLCLAIKRKLPAMFDTLSDCLVGIDGTVDKVVDAEKQWTALHVAAYYGRPYMIRKLIQLGADRDLKDKEFRTPLELAQEQNKAVVVSYLQEL